MTKRYTTLIFALYLLLVFAACNETGDPFGDSDKSAFFIKLYGGKQDQTGFDIRQKTDGGYLIAGTTNSFIDNSTTNIIDSLLLLDWEDDTSDTLDSRPFENESGAYLISTDSEGNEKWSLLYGMSDLYVIGSRLAISSSGNAFMLINYYDKMAIVEVDNSGHTVRKQPLDSNFPWVISGTNGNNRFKGNMHLVGEGDQECLLIIGNVGEVNNDSLGVVKLNLQLDILWEKKYKVGEQWDNGIDIYPQGDTYVIFSIADDTELNLLQITFDGRIIDKREYGKIEDVYSTSNEPRMIPSADGGGFVIVASSNPFERDGQLRFLQLDGSLNNINEKFLIAELGDNEKTELSARDIKALSDGYIILATKLNKSLSNEEQDFYLIKTDFSGNIIFSESYGNLDNNDAARVIQTQDGGFAILGTTDFSINTMISIVKTNAQGKLEAF